MAKPKIKWNLKAFEEVRKSAEVKDALQEVVDSILDNVNDDEELYKGNVSEGNTRAVGRVWTAGTHAERHNAKYNTLVRALSDAVDGDL